MTVRLRIALVSPLIGKSATGLSTYVADLVPRLCDAGHSVTLIGTDCGYRGGDAGELVKIDCRAAFHLFPVRGHWNRRLYRSSEMVEWFRHAISDFDVVDIQGVWTWIAADIAGICRASRVGYVLTPHGMMTHWDWRKQMLMKQVFFTTKLRKAWKGASAVRYLSDGEVQHSAVAAQAPYVIIPNAIEIPHTTAMESAARRIRHRLQQPDDAPLILFLGRVTDQKGVLELIQAFNILAAEVTTAQLVIAGPLEGDYGATVRQVAEGTGQGRIHVLGAVYGQAKYDLFAAASLFVTLSKNEGLSIAALEALSLGVPVVVTRESNLPEAESGGAGITTSCDPQVAAKRIAALLLEPARLTAMRGAARAVAEKHFSWRAVLPRLLSLYEQVAAKRDSRSGLSLMVKA